MIRRMIAPLTFAAVALHAGQAFAQGTFPAPLPGQAAPGNASPFPPVNRATPSASIGGALAPFEHRTVPLRQPGAAPNECMKGFFPLREEAEKRGKLIKAAGDRKAGPEEACKLIGSFGQAEMRIIRYVEANAAKCGFPQRITDQMKNGHKNTYAMERKVCAVARRPQWRGPPPVGPGDFDIRPLPLAVTG